MRDDHIKDENRDSMKIGTAQLPLNSTSRSAVTDNQTRGLRFLCRHLVGLCVTYRHERKGEELLPARFATCSGTLLLIEGMLYFLTAGHVLKQLKDLRDNSQVLVEGASLADVFGLNRVSDTPIPFDLQNAKFCLADCDESGLDFGVIPLGLHHAQLLAKNGMVALSEENWARQDSLQLDGYLMLGFPAEFTSERVSDESTVSIQPTLFAVQRLDSTEDRRTTFYPRFVGKISEDLPLKSLEGMSGGLILGFQLSPKPRYWIVAIQSSWHRGSGMVYGTSLPILASLMTHWSRQNIPVLKELDQNTTEICLNVPGAVPPGACLST